MKAKKRVLSTILSLSSILLVGCNKKTTSSSSCSISTSTPTIESTPESTPEPTPEPTPSKTVEELNKELFDNYAITKEDVNSEKGTYLTGFKDNIPEQYLNLETIIIPEKIGDISLDYISSGTSNSNNVFTIFSKVKTIKIPSTIKTIYNNPNGSFATAFTNLPNLESIEVDSNNQWYYTKGNCLIQRNWKTDSATLERTLTGSLTLKCGWSDVEIPEEITSTIDNAFNNNSSITSVKLHSKVNITYKAFKYLDKLNNIDLNGNTTYKIENNVMYKEQNSAIYGAWDSVTIPSSITKLDLSGFSSVTSIVLYDTVTELSDFAFSGTKIKTLFIPASVTSIPNNAFDKLTDIYGIEIEPQNQNYYVTDNVILTKTGQFVYAWGDAIIPDSKKGFSDVTFENCYSLISLTLHNKIESVSLTSFSLIPEAQFKTLNYKGTVSEFKTKVGLRNLSIYELVKKYTTITVNFLKDDVTGIWSIDKSYKMSELESIN